MTTEDPVLESLELAAEAAGDITEPVYQRYYAAHPTAGELMSHVDQHMQGRMMDEVLRLLMNDDIAAEQAYLDFEVANHSGYRVALDMYPDLFDAVRVVVRDAVGKNWTDAFEQAWAERIAALAAAIELRASRV